MKAHTKMTFLIIILAIATVAASINFNPEKIINKPIVVKVK